MINPNNIMPGMPVISSDESQFATVDFIVYEDAIKLKNGKDNMHHYIPVSWVVSTENGKVVIDRPAAQAMHEWSMIRPWLASLY